MEKIDSTRLATFVESARDRYVRLHRQGSMATVSAIILFDALRDDIARTGREQAITTFTRGQLRDRMREHPAWEGKAFEETSFNTVPEDLGDQLDVFTHEEYFNGRLWRLTFRGPTRKFRKDQSSRELFLEVGCQPVDDASDAAPGAATIGGSSERPGGLLSAPLIGATEVGRSEGRWLRWLIPLVFLAIAAVVVVLVLQNLDEPPAERGPAQSQGPLTIAVLPFRLLTADDDMRYLGMGIADAIIIRLSNLGQTRVRPTSAILKYQNLEGDASRAGRELGADYLLSGTLQHSTDRFRAAAQLIRVSDGSSVWGRQFDVPRADLFSLEDQIAENVAAALQIQLSAEQRARMMRRYTSNAQAYESYLKGRAALLGLTREETQLAVRFFEQALSQDPSFAPARAGLANACAQMRIRFAPKTEVMRWETRAKEEALRAVELAPDLAEAHEALAAVSRYSEFDWPGTMEESTKALQLNPNLELAYYYRSAAGFHLGLPEMADREARRGLELNPTRPTEAVRLLGVNAMLSGKYDESVRYLEEVAARTDAGDYFLGLAYHYAGREPEALSLLTRLGGGETRQLRAAAAHASLLAAAGKRQEAQNILAQIIGEPQIDHHVSYSIGAAYAQLGDAKSANEWLEKSAATGFPCEPWFRLDPLLDPLRKEGRFMALMGRLEEMHRAAQQKYDR